MSEKMKSNTQRAIIVLWIVMGLNLGVAILKIIIGTLANSGSIIADGYHSLSDGSGNIVGIIGLSIAGKPKDDGHPYGHKKFETLSSLLIGVLLFLVACKVAYSAVLNIIDPQIATLSTLSFIVMALTLVVNIFVVRFESSQGKKLFSDVLISDSEHTKSDILITCGVLLTMVLLRIGAPPVIDGVVSLLISGFIFKASYDIFMESSHVLADAAVIRSQEIFDLVMTCEGVKDCHKIRSRGRKDDVHIDLHILVDPSISVAVSHTLEHSVEALLKRHYGECVSAIVHVEPYVAKTNG